MGDWIKFRGHRRFVVGIGSCMLILERLQPNSNLGQYVFYNVASAEKATIRVIIPATARARTRARRMLEAELQPWTTIEWHGDEPVYVHDQAKFRR